MGFCLAVSKQINTRRNRQIFVPLQKFQEPMIFEVNVTEEIWVQ